jgi:hypothetical protein
MSRSKLPKITIAPIKFLKVNTYQAPIVIHLKGVLSNTFKTFKAFPKFEIIFLSRKTSRI